MEDGLKDHEAWPARAAMLAGLGALLGILLDIILDGAADGPSEDPLRMSLAASVAVSGIVFAFTLERLRWTWSAAFALLSGIIVALVFFWNGSPDGWSAGDGWRLFAALLAVAIAAPLFQSVRDAGGWRLRYPEIHAHAWTNIVLWGAAWAFVLVTWLLAQLLAELFNLIGIDLLREALRESWFSLALIGAALGAATGLLRDRDQVLGLLQRVVTTVLSVLAPVLAAGLVLFVLALPFTGLSPLWDKTSSTTPILLIAIAGAFLLTNAVIGNSPEEEARTRVLRWSAMALAAVMAPLAVVAAISTWLRIDQHGFTPERLWALVFVIVVLAVAVTYLWAIVSGRSRWSERIRPANIRLALGICAIALLLATPLINFGAISTRDQLARLQSGEVKPEEFDWAALRFDFGPAGRRALERLSEAGPPQLRARAKEVLGIKDRWTVEEQVRTSRTSARLASSLRVMPRPVPLPAALAKALAEQQVCSFGPCTLIWTEGAREAFAVGFGCEACQASATRLVLDGKGQWQSRPMPPLDTTSVEPPETEAQQRAMEQGQVEVRPVQRRQVYVGGKPVGPPFE